MKSLLLSYSYTNQDCRTLHGTKVFNTNLNIPWHEFVQDSLNSIKNNLLSMTRGDLTVTNLTKLDEYQEYKHES